MNEPKAENNQGEVVEENFHTDHLRTVVKKYQNCLE